MEQTREEIIRVHPIKIGVEMWLRKDWPSLTNINKEKRRFGGSTPMQAEQNALVMQ
jgi:hypothetical protein